MIEVFLLCALSARPVAFHGSQRFFVSIARQINVAWTAGSDPLPPSIEREKSKIIEWIRKNNPDAEVFINPHPDEERLRDHGWERVPVRWRDNDIWIRRKPNIQKVIETNA